MKVLLRSSLTSGTERGTDTFELMATLLKMGIEVFLDPTDVHPPVPSLLASALTKSYPDRFDLTLHYVDPVNAEIPRAFIKSSDLNVLWTSHAQTMFPTANKKIGPALQDYDVILAQDEVTYNALSPLLDRNPLPLGLLAPGFNSDPWSPITRSWSTDAPFRFCMVLTGHPSEFPERAIEAFHLLRTGRGDATNPGYEEFENVELIIKTLPDDDLNMNLMEHVPGLSIVKASWDERMFKKFYKDMHCFVSMDRGGVRNRAAMQFLATGGTAIATDWSLNKSWLTNGWAYPVKYDLTVSNHRDNRSKFAEPNIFDLQEKMLDVVQNRYTIGMSKGQLAGQMMPVMLDWSKVLESMFNMLEEIAPGGSEFYEKYQRCQPVKEEAAPWKM